MSFPLRLILRLLHAQEPWLLGFWKLGNQKLALELALDGPPFKVHPKSEALSRKLNH